MRHSKFTKFCGGLLLFLALLALGALIVMTLWNCVITCVCGYTAVSFWQALALLVLGLTLSGGLLLPVLGILHTFRPEHKYHKELVRKWREMNEEQRRKFLSTRGFNVSE